MIVPLLLGVSFMLILDIWSNLDARSGPLNAEADQLHMAVPHRCLIVNLEFLRNPRRLRKVVGNATQVEGVVCNMFDFGD